MHVKFVYFFIAMVLGKSSGWLVSKKDYWLEVYTCLLLKSVVAFILISL